MKDTPLCGVGTPWRGRVTADLREISDTCAVNVRKTNCALKCVNQYFERDALRCETVALIQSHGVKNTELGSVIT